MLRGCVDSAETLGDEWLWFRDSADGILSQPGLQTCSIVSRARQGYPRVDLLTRLFLAFQK